MAIGTREAPAPWAGESGQSRRRWLALAVLCVTLLIVNLDNTVLNVALPTLVRDLNATSSQLQWIVGSYPLVFAGLLLVSGSLADRVGRKRTFVAGLSAFACASAWAAFSGSVPMLIAARAAMGVGAAGVNAAGRSRSRTRPRATPGPCPAGIWRSPHLPARSGTSRSSTGCHRLRRGHLAWR